MYTSWLSILDMVQIKHASTICVIKNERIRLLVVTLHPLCDITCDMVCWEVCIEAREVVLALPKEYMLLQPSHTHVCFVCESFGC